jgi:hypothetical protein
MSLEDNFADILLDCTYIDTLTFLSGKHKEFLDDLKHRAMYCELIYNCVNYVERSKKYEEKRIQYLKDLNDLKNYRYKKSKHDATLKYRSKKRQEKQEKISKRLKKISDISEIPEIPKI